MSLNDGRASAGVARRSALLPHGVFSVFRYFDPTAMPAFTSFSSSAVAFRSCVKPHQSLALKGNLGFAFTCSGHLRVMCGFGGPQNDVFISIVEEFGEELDLAKALRQRVGIAVSRWNARSRSWLLLLWNPYIPGERTSS
jgi:hypothetical protein